MKEIKLHQLLLLLGITLNHLENVKIKIGKKSVLKISMKKMKQLLIIALIAMMKLNYKLINKLEIPNNLDSIFTLV